MKLLGGNPQAIILVAPLLSDTRACQRQSLKSLYT